MGARVVVATVLALAMWSPRSASPEVIELNGGDWVEGTLKEATPAGVTVEVGGQTITFAADRVRAIYYRASGDQAPTAGTPPRPPSASVRPAAGPPPGPPAPARGSSPAADALLVVKSLRSAILGGMTLTEYQARVNATVTIVDRYLAALPDGPESESINDAVRYFVLAESAWNNQGAASRTVWLRKVDALERCPAYQAFARAMQSKGDAFYAERVTNYVVISDGVISVLWSCASEKIAEAETLLATTQK